MDPQFASPAGAPPGFMPGAAGAHAIDWSAAVIPVFAPVQVFGPSGFPPPQAHVAPAVLPPAPAFPLAPSHPVFEITPPMPASAFAAPVHAHDPPAQMLLPPMPLASIEALPPKPVPARSAPAAVARPADAGQSRAVQAPVQVHVPVAKQKTAGKPAADRQKRTAQPPKVSPAAPAQHSEAERVAQAEMGQRIGDLVVFFVPIVCFVSTWHLIYGDALLPLGISLWWPVKLALFIFAAGFVWRLGLAVALRILLAQRGQALHTAREPGDPAVWERLRAALADPQLRREQRGQATSAEFEGRMEQVAAGLRAEGRALAASLGETRAQLAQRVKAAARDVAHVAPQAQTAGWSSR